MRDCRTWPVNTTDILSRLGDSSDSAADASVSIDAVWRWLAVIKWLADNHLGMVVGCALSPLLSDAGFSKLGVNGSSTPRLL